MCAALRCFAPISRFLALLCASVRCFALPCAASRCRAFTDQVPTTIRPVQMGHCFCALLCGTVPSLRLLCASLRCCALRYACFALLRAVIRSTINCRQLPSGPVQMGRCVRCSALLSVALRFICAALRSSVPFCHRTFLLQTMLMRLLLPTLGRPTMTILAGI